MKIKQQRFVIDVVTKEHSDDIHLDDLCDAMIDFLDNLLGTSYLLEVKEDKTKEGK